MFLHEHFSDAEICTSPEDMFIRCECTLQSSYVVSDILWCFLHWALGLNEHSGKHTSTAACKAPQSCPAHGPAWWKGTGEQHRAGSSRQVPARQQAALACKQGSAYAQTSGHFFPSHHVDTILSVDASLWGRKVFSPSHLKLRAHSSWQSGAHYQLALVLSSCANCAVLTMILS